MEKIITISRGKVTGRAICDIVYPFPIITPRNMIGLWRYGDKIFKYYL